MPAEAGIQEKLDEPWIPVPRLHADKLHGNNLSSYNIPISHPVVNEPINTMQQGCHVKWVSVSMK